MTWARRWLAARPLARSLLWGMASALALPPVHLLPVLLLSVPALLRLIGEAPGWRRAALTGYAFGFGLNLAGLYWITEPILTEAATFWWLVPFACPLLAAAVAFFTVVPAIAAWLAPAGLSRVLVLAGAWVLSNLAQQFAFTGFPWNLWGTDWAIPGRLGDILIQPASVVGVHGLTLFTLLLAATPLFRGRGAAALAAALAVWVGYGVWRLAAPPPDTPVQLALVQPNFPVPGSFDRASLLARWHRLESMSAAGLHAGATAVVWPEAASPWLMDSDSGARQQLADVTGTAPILAGSLRAVSENDYRNALVVTAGPVPPFAIYDKWKLVPFGEYVPRWIPVKIIPSALGSGFTPGDGPHTLHVSGLPPFAPIICYEAIFSGEIVDERHRPDWIVNVTDDAWFGNSAGPRQHFADVRLRAVEEGLPLARAANSGISAMFDAFGHVDAALPLGAQGVLVARLPGVLPATPYARHGLMIPLVLSVVAMLAGAVLGMRQRRLLPA